MRRSGGLPHLARWFDLVSRDPLLVSVGTDYGPKKPASRTEYRKEVAAAGMGGGGAPVLAPYLTHAPPVGWLGSCMLGAACESDGSCMILCQYPPPR
jgi:hypothetical protein